VAPPSLTVASLLDGVDATDAGVVRLFERVRDIPFSVAAHSDADTLLACGFGTCAPKHALLARLDAAAGLETRFVYVSFRFDHMPGAFPPDLQALIHDGVVRTHAALQVTEGWDGPASMPLTVRPLARVESALPPEHEEALLGIRHRTGLSLRAGATAAAR
jgi:transglutaminase-like putative cysteine protease